MRVLFYLQKTTTCPTNSQNPGHQPPLPRRSWKPPWPPMPPTSWRACKGELAELEGQERRLADQFLRPRPRRRTPAAAPKRSVQGPQVRASRALPKACCRVRQPGCRPGHQGSHPQQLREGADATLRQLTSALERNKVVVIINPQQAPSSTPPASGHQRGASRTRGQHHRDCAAKAI